MCAYRAILFQNKYSDMFLLTFSHLQYLITMQIISKKISHCIRQKTIKKVKHLSNRKLIHNSFHLKYKWNTQEDGHEHQSRKKEPADTKTLTTNRSERQEGAIWSAHKHIDPGYKKHLLHRNVLPPKSTLNTKSIQHILLLILQYWYTGFAVTMQEINFALLHKL